MTGDLTDSGERSEFLRFRALMDSAGLPYLPFIGNHDVWPYVSASDEAAYAWGDSLAAVFFADVYQSFSQRVLAWESASLLYSVPNPETGFRSRFHHFTFVYGGVRFVGVEGVSRQPAPLGQAGVGPQADLHDFPGGTFRFSGYPAWDLSALSAGVSLSLSPYQLPYQWNQHLFSSGIRPNRGPTLPPSR